jgi:maltooligosyltrehalose trehalohydrolase
MTLSGHVNTIWTPDIGASVMAPGTVRFRVWAPRADLLGVRIITGDSQGTHPLMKTERGYFEAVVKGVSAGDRYLYDIGGAEYPDPASRHQPEGVHRASAVVDPSAFPWSDTAWKGISLEQYIIYELHVGTFTPEGTFATIIPRLGYLKDLGITAIELMPVSQFPGERNWGYDGVHPFAPQNTYGGPGGLKQLINACHDAEVAVILDVVYNHLGPEGNYLGRFAPYVTDRYRTRWGEAINFDGAWSDEVRHFFVTNALYWITEYHVDALRIDAIQGIFDRSANPFIRELGEAVRQQAGRMGRSVYVIPESDLNDVRVIAPIEAGGYALDAQWNDDFHHCLHTLLTGERSGYYQDFGLLAQLEKAYREGFVYSGGFSQYRMRRHGSSSGERGSTQFVVFSQNHDQVGNRAAGDRLCSTQPLEKLKVAAAAVMFSANIPLVFMGEEYGETAPFQYFVSHTDPALVEAVRKGRKEEFATFGWRGEIPDPQAESTFLRSKINLDLHRSGQHAVLHRYYRNLISMRKCIPALSHPSKERLDVKGFEDEKLLFLIRWFEDDMIFCIFCFHNEAQQLSVSLPQGEWERILDTSAREWGGKGGETAVRIVSSVSPVTVFINPHSALIYRKGGSE